VQTKGRYRERSTNCWQGRSEQPATATAQPQPTRDLDAAASTAPVPAEPTPAAPANVELEVLRALTNAGQARDTLYAIMGTNPDCQAMIGACDRLVVNPGLDVSGAPIGHQAAYQVLLETITVVSEPSAINDMVSQCRVLLAAGETHGQFSREFYKAVENEFLWQVKLHNALKSIGGE
jgi:hypothetical protein